MHMKKSTLNFKMLTLAAALFTLSAGVTGQVLVENFDGLEGNNTDSEGQKKNWNGNDNFPTVDRAYQAGDAVKLGTSSKNGSLTTKKLDLSANNGAIRITLSVKGWTKIEGDLKVSILGTNKEAIVKYAAIMADPFENKEIIFESGGTDSTVIKFESTAKRLFLDNIYIYSHSVDAPSITSPSSFTYARIDKNASTTENITIKGANLTGDLSVEVSGAPFSSTVTTITQAEALAGYDIPVTFAPTSRGIFTGQLIINGGGLAEPKTIALKGEAHGDLDPSDFDISAPVASISFDFEDITNNVDFEAEGWSNINVKNDRKWQGKTFTQGGVTDRYVQATAYSSSNQSSEEFDIWLVTPAIDFGALAAGTKFTFDQAVLGAEPNTTFGVYHIAMNGNTVVKTKLTIDKNATVNNQWLNTEADISGLSGVGFIAFNYNRVAGVTTPASYRVDNVKLGVSTAVKNPSAETVSVYVKEGTIVVDVKVPGGMIEVFNIAGQRVASQPAMEGSNTISLPQGQIYIVKTGSFVQKVAL